MNWLPPNAALDMGTEISFVVQMEPRGKGRPRAFVNKATGRADAHTDKQTVAWEHDFKMLTIMARLRTSEKIRAIAGRPMWVGLVLLYKKPKKAKWFCTKAIDNDNAEKLVWDSMQGLFFENDNRIVANATYKDWAPGEPCLHVHIYALKEKKSP